MSLTVLTALRSCPISVRGWHLGHIRRASLLFVIYTVVFSVLPVVQRVLTNSTPHRMAFVHPYMDAATHIMG